MADLIDRDAVLKKFIEGYGDDDFTTGYNWAVDEYRQKIAEIPAVNRWIPVEDALPEENEYVLAFVKRRHSSRVILSVLIDREWKIGVNDCSDGFNVVGVITHWMPLPEPPEGGADNG